MEVIRKKINDINIDIVRTDKFKTISLQVVFANEFTRENATKRALLARVLGNSSKKYNTKKKSVDKSCELYNAEVSVGYTRYYRTSLIAFTLDVVNEKNLECVKNLTKKAIDFLNDSIFNPNVDDNKFSEKEFNEEKRLLKEAILKIYNNKQRFALKRMLEIMCKDEITGINSMGNLDDLETITPKILYDEYLKMITTDDISIYVVGDIEEKDVIKHLKPFSLLKNKKKKLETVSFEEIGITEIKEYSEIQKINQSKLVMGYRTDINSVDKRYPHLSIFNSMFGGLFSSDLFRVIREENGLAYDISSRDIPSSKLFIITAGIESDNYHQIVKLITDELDKYKNGDINRDLLEEAKQSLVSELLETEDNPYSYIAHIQNNYFTGMNMTISDEISEVERVTIEDIQEVAKSIILDTVFLLSNGSSYGN
ncbi:MAG: pitrilysin family protein [Bacilli bacterium]|nr:pitrilysin family protein [Bacilli bacterium]